MNQNPFQKVGNESEDIQKLIYYKKEQFSNQARKLYRDQIFQKKRVKTIAEKQLTSQNSSEMQPMSDLNDLNEETQMIQVNMQMMKSQNIEQVKISLKYFKNLASKAAQLGGEFDIVRRMVDNGMIYELIELFNSTKDQTGKYLLPNDIATDGLYVLAIIASGDEFFINSIIDKNGLIVFKDYSFLTEIDPQLLSSAYLGLVNLCSLNRKEVRQYLKGSGLLEHIQNIIVNNISRLHIDEYKEMVENGVWLVSVLCYDPPEGEIEFNQLFNTLPFLIQCLNTENVKLIKDVIWIIDICLTQIPSKKSTQPDLQFSQKLLSLGLHQAFNKTVKIENKKIKGQSFRGINKLMKLSSGNEIDLIYNAEQINYILSVLKSKHIHNQYYGINYLNELCYQNRFQDFIKVDAILKQLMLIVEQKSSDKFTQLILQSILKIMENGEVGDIKILFESETTLVYSEDGEKTAPQNIILSLQILSQAYQHAISNSQYLVRLQRMNLERFLLTLQSHPLENIYQLNLHILDKYYEED